MIHSQRVIFDDNGTLSDLSIELNDFRSGTATIPYIAADDYIYIGSDLPFNHRYIEAETPNDQASSPSVDIWFSNQWIAAVDIVDRTTVSGVPLAQSGVFQWTTNRLKGWDIEQDSDDVDGLEGTAIYNMYWVRLSFSADLKNTTELKYIGHLFSDDDDLYTYYPDLQNVNLLDSFESGKTTWKEQHLAAAQLIIRDLKKRGLIWSSSQVLDYELLLEPSIHKVAMIIYGAAGVGFLEQATRAREAYLNSMQLRFFNTDTNADARLNPKEKTISTRRMRR